MIRILSDNSLPGLEQQVNGLEADGYWPLGSVTADNGSYIMVVSKTRTAPQTTVKPGVKKS
jgi:hypothetical protein